MGRAQENVGEISAAALAHAEQVLEQLMQDRTHRAKWFGAHVTEPVGGPDPVMLNPQMDWRELVLTVTPAHRPRMLYMISPSHYVPRSGARTEAKLQYGAAVKQL
jgi:hypothetical protein